LNIIISYILAKIINESPFFDKAEKTGTAAYFFMKKKIIEFSFAKGNIKFMTHQTKRLELHMQL